MIEAHYWWDEAVRLTEQACASEDVAQQAELIDLAEACAAIAIDVEDRSTGG